MTNIGTIKANVHSEGSLNLSRYFLSLPPITRADILRDILFAMQSQYEAALRESRKEFETKSLARV